MGAIWWGTRVTCPLHFFRRGGHNMPCLPTKEFSMLDVTNSHVDVETVFGVVSLILMFL